MGDSGDSRGKRNATVPAWDAVVLVCRDCRKRSSGPRALKPKALARTLKQSLRAEQPRPRVLLTNCLGLCPKRATAVARVGGGGAAVGTGSGVTGARVAAVETAADALLAMTR